MFCNLRLFVVFWRNVTFFSISILTFLHDSKHYWDQVSGSYPYSFSLNQPCARSVLVLVLSVGSVISAACQLVGVNI